MFAKEEKMLIPKVDEVIVCDVCKQEIRTDRQHYIIVPNPKMFKGIDQHYHMDCVIFSPKRNYAYPEAGQPMPPDMKAAILKQQDILRRRQAMIAHAINTGRLWQE